MKKYKTMDANEAVSQVAYNYSDICGIYPITPASPMAENIDKLSNQGEKNYFNRQVKVVEMQSEAGAIALVHGSLQAGTLATTFTASQGLLLMIPTLYKLSGEMLPAVIHVASRSLATHALSIFGDHQDIYATRTTGVCLLASSSVEQSYHLSNVAHLSAISASLPFIHFFDGFRTSHEINKIALLEGEDLKKLIDINALKEFKNKRLNPLNPNTRGTAENDDIYFQHAESRNKDYQKVPEIVSKYMKEINKITNKDYQPFNYYGSPKAKNIIVAMGSVCETIKETIDDLNQQNYQVGLIEVHLYRPFSKEYLLKVLPKTVKNIAVLDRTKEPGANGEPLYLDIVESLKEYHLEIIGGRYGLSSKNTAPNQIKAVYDYLNTKDKHNFTIGIDDDVTKLSLKVDPNYRLNNNQYEMLIYGYGSDGMVSTSKDIIKIIGDNTNNYVQGYFQYDSKKSGGVTRSHLRIANDQIKSTYYVDNPSLIVISKDNYLYKYDCLKNIKEKGILLLNTNLNKTDLLNSLPDKVKYQLANKKIKLYIINANKIVENIGLKNIINTSLEICIFKLLDIFKEEKIKDILKESNHKRFISKGEDIVNVNNQIIDESLKYLEEVSIPNEWKNISYEEKKYHNTNDVINHLEGDSLKVSAFINNKSGIFDANTTKYEKRNIAVNVPVWNKDNCIQCNACSFVCPHAVIRPYLHDDDSLDSLEAIGDKEKRYTISISYDDCTGCGLCVKTCPGKKNEKALKMVENFEHIKEQQVFNLLEAHNHNDTFPVKNLNVKTLGFIEPKFAFSGACAGCGETPYLKNLTQIVNKNLIIANATGCSSIYGASAPNTPYNLPWANSLFEDNAEFGLGILNGINQRRKRAYQVIQDNLNKVDEETSILLNKWLNNHENIEICEEVYQNLNYQKYPFLEHIKEEIPKKTIFIVGGDGFAYDIGYNGIDQVLSMNENINILVLDTETYSNTGGQASKSTNIGATAAFASKGKRTYKKDLAKIALTYPHVYVACVNINYNKEQYIKVIKEAINYNGPSIIIAYAPCIEHGIKGGMENAIENGYLATSSGYFLTMHYNPETELLLLDSKEPNLEDYDKFLNQQNRYQKLKKIDESLAESLLKDNKEWSIKRYQYYSKLSENK